MNCIALIESAEHGYFVTLLHKNTPFLPVDRAQKNRMAGGFLTKTIQRAARQVQAARPYLIKLAALQLLALHEAVEGGLGETEPQVLVTAELRIVCINLAPVFILG